MESTLDVFHGVGLATRYVPDVGQMSMYLQGGDKIEYAIPSFIPSWLIGIIRTAQK